MDARCRIHHIDERCCFAQRDDVTLSFWSGPPTAELIDTQRSVLERAIRQHKQILSMTSFRIADFDMKLMRDGTIQSRFEALAKLVDGPLVAHALVVEGTGFSAAILRSSATSLAFVLRSKVSTKAFDTPQSAARWLASRRPSGEVDGEGATLESFVTVILERMRAATVAPTGSIFPKSNR